MDHATLEEQIRALTGEIGTLKYRVDVLRSRSNANSRFLEAELVAKIDDREQRLLTLQHMAVNEIDGTHGS